MIANWQSFWAFTIWSRQGLLIKIQIFQRYNLNNIQLQVAISIKKMFGLFHDLQ